MSESNGSPSPKGLMTSSEIISMYDEMFTDRYTEKDEEYVKTLSEPLPDPPCVENWYQRPKRSFDFARGGRGGRGGFRDRDRGDRHHGGRNWHGRDNRDWHGRDNRNYGRDQHGHHGRGGSDRVYYPGRRDDRQQQRYQPYDQGQRHNQGHRQDQRQRYDQGQRYDQRNQQGQGGQWR